LSRVARPSGPSDRPADSLVEAWLDQYVPDLAGPEHAQMIREAVRRACPGTVGAAGTMAGSVSGYVMWAQDTGLPVTHRVLFDPETIDRYVAVAMGTLGYGPATRMSAHSQLYAVAGASGYPVPATGHRYRSARPGSRPYTGSETDGLVVWADAQRSPRTRHALLAVLGLTLGAGLTARDVAGLLGSDIRRGPHPAAVRVTVRGGDRPRTVPVLTRYADLVEEHALTAGEHWVVRPDKPGDAKLLSDYIHKARPDASLPMLSPARCRATWIRGHLEAGTRLDVLIGAAGHTNVASLYSHVRSASPVDQAPFRDPRRGQGRPAVPVLLQQAPR